MNERRNRRWPGFALLGILAVVCVLSNVLIWWLVRQPMAVQPRGFSFVIDVQLIRQAVWGIVFIQPAIISVYLAYGKHSSFIRVVVTAVVFFLLCVANLVGWGFLSDPAGSMFVRHHEFVELTAVFATQVIGLSLATWASRIMRGWQLGCDEETAKIDQQPITRLESVVETAMLLLLSVAAIFGLGWATSETPSIGAFYFAMFGLVGTVVVAPIAFFSLRFRSFAVIVPALLLLLFALPLVLFGLLSGLEYLTDDNVQFDIWKPISSAFFAAVNVRCGTRINSSGWLPAPAAAV